MFGERLKQTLNKAFCHLFLSPDSLTDIVKAQVSITGGDQENRT